MGYKNFTIFTNKTLYLANDTRCRIIVTIECEYETVPKLLNGTNFNELE